MDGVEELVHLDAGVNAFRCKDDAGVAVPEFKRSKNLSLSDTQKQ